MMLDVKVDLLLIAVMKEYFCGTPCTMYKCMRRTCVGMFVRPLWSSIQEQLIRTK